MLIIIQNLTHSLPEETRLGASGYDRCLIAGHWELGLGSHQNCLFIGLEIVMVDIIDLRQELTVLQVIVVKVGIVVEHARV